MRAMVEVTWPLLLLATLASASGFTSVKRDSDTELDREEVEDFFEEIENAQEVLEVPLMEYEDDNKPSKMTRAAIMPHHISFMLIQGWMRESILYLTSLLFQSPSATCGRCGAARPSSPATSPRQTPATRSASC